MQADRLEAIADELLARGETLEPILPRPYVPWDPWPKQAAFLSPIANQIEEVFYGGGVGGAKTVALLMAALQFVEVPGYSAVLVRKTFPMLDAPDSLIPLAREWLLGTDASYNEGKHVWTFPSGATLRFRHIADQTAVADFQGASYQFIGIDEVTDFTLEEYTFVTRTRLRRRAASTVPLRIRCASNPWGKGKDWVYQRFVLKGATEGRLFVPALLEDNPGIDREQYEETLRGLGESSPMYRALRFGDWTAKREGGMFKRGWFEVVKPSDVPADAKRVRNWDLAATATPEGAEAKRQGDPDWTVGLRLARARGGTYYVEDVQRFRENPGEVERRIAQTAREDREARGRFPIRMEQEPGASGKTVIAHYRTEVLDGYEFRGVPSSGSKELRAGPAAARAEHGEIKLVAGSWIEAFLDELADFPEGLHDDQVDALSGAFEHLADKARGRTRASPPKSFTAGSHWTGA